MVPHLYFVSAHVLSPPQTVSAHTECVQCVCAVSVRTPEMDAVLLGVLVTQLRHCEKRGVLTRGMSVTFVAGALSVRRRLFDKLVPPNSLTTGLQLPNARAC